MGKGQNSSLPHRFHTHYPVVKVDRRIRWHYATTILRLRIGARLTRYRNCKFHNCARTIVPPSAGPLLPLPISDHQTICHRWLLLYWWPQRLRRIADSQHFEKPLNRPTATIRPEYISKASVVPGIHINKQPHRYANSHAILAHTVLPAIRPRWHSSYWISSCQILIRTAIFLQKFIVSENSLCMLFANDVCRQLHNIFYTVWWQYSNRTPATQCCFC